ncbi:hypothetical protein L345_04203, partial [Ophiophagus hannah]
MSSLLISWRVIKSHSEESDMEESDMEESDMEIAVPPKLKEMKSQESAVGQTLVLRCEASTEHLSLKFKWLKNGKEITKRNRPENVKIKSPKKQKTFSELRITKASLDDAGEYTCKASNRFGDDSIKAEVTIADTSEPTGMIPVLTKGVNASSPVYQIWALSTCQQKAIAVERPAIAPWEGSDIRQPQTEVQPIKLSPTTFPAPPSLQLC